MGDVIEMSRNSVQQVKNSVFEKEDDNIKMIRHASSPDIHKEQEKLAENAAKAAETNS